MKTVFPHQEKYEAWEVQLIISTYQDMESGEITEWSISEESQSSADFRDFFLIQYHELRQLACDLFAERPQGLDHEGMIAFEFPDKDTQRKTADANLISAFKGLFAVEAQEDLSPGRYFQSLKRYALTRLDCAEDPTESRMYMCYLEAVSQLLSEHKRKKRRAT